MDVVYLFYESAVTRIPFFSRNKRLFNLLAVRGSGTWDGARQEFVFNRRVIAEQLSKIIPGIPCVCAEENSSDQLRILGFWDRLWDKAPGGSSVKKVEVNRIAPPGNPFAFPVQPLLPEKLSEYWRSKLEAELRSRKYSPRTRSAYIYYNRLLCRTLQKTPEEIRPDDITQFLADMEKDREYSASSMNIAISAIKFFFKNVQKNDCISEQRRPRQDERLPMVLSKEEISKVLSLEKNPKHRLLLMLVYSSGLRVSEVVTLKREHIDLSRKVIYIRLGKGRKDRSTILSDKAAAYIEEYCTFYNIEKWLFPGQQPTRPLTIRSAQHIFDKAVRRAGILKKITIHGLRHTFATHLLESGTDIRYIQTLLGHANIRTTERYTHVAKRSVLNIKSPLDSIL